MAHDYVSEGLAVKQQTGRISLQILATLVGGMLLVASFIASWAFGPGTVEGKPNVYAAILGAIAAILLGAPLVWVAIKDMIRGHMHMNELVALAVIAAFAIQDYQESAAIAFFMIIAHGPRRAGEHRIARPHHADARASPDG
jgi:Zn2+/Cd2+-exporting ATPase